MEKVGIQNIGNTCFMNAVLQAMLHTPILWKHFWKPFVHYDKRGEAIAKELHNIFTTALIAKPRVMRLRGEVLSIQPDKFVDAFEASVRGHRNIRYRRGTQLCSAEVSRYLFDALHSYLSTRFTMEITPGSGDSAIITRQTHSLEAFIKMYTRSGSDIEKGIEKGFSEIADKFHGQTQAITICTNCKTVSSENYESWEMLPLAIPGSATHGATAPSLLDCIADLFNDALIEDYWCETCKLRDKVREACVKTHAPRNGTCCRDCYKLATAVKRNRISRFPEYISIELKRYMRNPMTERTHKVIGGIQWDLDNLNLEPFAAFHESPFKTLLPHYKTYAVIEHVGRTPDSGHYYARARRGDKWFEFNDDIPAEEILKEDIITNNSYIIYATSDPTYDKFFTTELPAYKRYPAATAAAAAVDAAAAAATAVEAATKAAAAVRAPNGTYSITMRTRVGLTQILYNHSEATSLAAAAADAAASAATVAAAAAADGPAYASAAAYAAEAAASATTAAKAAAAVAAAAAAAAATATVATVVEEKED